MDSVFFDMYVPKAALLDKTLQDCEKAKTLSWIFLMCFLRLEFERFVTLVTFLLSWFLYGCLEHVF